MEEQAASPTANADSNNQRNGDEVRTEGVGITFS